MSLGNGQTPEPDEVDDELDEDDFDYEFDDDIEEETEEEIQDLRRAHEGDFTSPPPNADSGDADVDEDSH